MTYKKKPLLRRSEKSLQAPAINSSLWKRVIACERSRAASAYGIIWGEGGQNKHGGESSAIMAKSEE